MNYIRKSVIDSETIAKALGFRLPARNATRWNSMFYMLRKYVDATEKDPILMQDRSRLNAVRELRPLSAYEMAVFEKSLLSLHPLKVRLTTFRPTLSA